MKSALKNIIKKISSLVSSPRFLSGVLMVGMVVVMGVMFAPTKIHAQQTVYQTCIASGLSASDCAQAPNANAPSNNPTGQNIPNTNNNNPNGNGGSSFFDITLAVLLKIVDVIVNIIQMIIALFLGLAGLLLNATINYSVKNLATNITGLKGIGVAWTLIRDLCNMSFIFILLYEAIMMVFGKGDAKKIIVPIIVAALLINFSLFFTEIIIDASNVVTSSFYNSLITIQNSASGSSTLTTTNGTGTNGGAATVQTTGLSGAIMDDLNLTSMFSASAFPTGANTAYNILIYDIGSALFMLITTFIFLAMALLFLIRYIAFILLLILSPIGFVSGAIPGTEKLHNKFWETLWGQVLFAPIFMIMMWIILTIISPGNGNLFGVNTATCSVVGSTTKVVCDLGTAITSPSASSVGIILNFFIIIGLLIATITISKSYATKGGVVGGKAVGQATGFLGSAVFGTTASIGRNTIGRFGKATADNEDLKKRASDGSKLAQFQLNVANRAAKGTFDARQTYAGEKVSDLSGVKLGKGTIFNEKAGKGGYEARLKDKKEAEKKYAESLKPSDDAEVAAKEKLKDEKFIAEEKDAKEKHLADLDEEIKKKKAELGIDKKEAEKKEAEVAKKEAEVELKKVTDEKTAAEEKIVKLQKDLAANRVDGGKKIIQDQIDEEKRNLSTVTADVAEKQADVVKKQAVATEKTAELTEALKPIQKQLDTREEDGRNWVSEKTQKVIATSGGQKEEKYTKEEIQADPSLKGKTKTREVPSAKNERIGNYATSLETKPTWARAWMGTPKINKQAAIEVRKAMKGKSANDLIAEAVKKEAKDKEEVEGGGEKEEKKTEEKKKENTPKAA